MQGTTSTGANLKTRQGRLARRRVVPLLLVLAALPVSTRAQLPPTFGEIAEVELVLVDVLVTDPDGMPVLDLTQEDFTLFVDGERREIAQFSGPGIADERAEEDGRNAGRVAEDEDATVPKRGPNHLLVLYLDDQNLLPTGRHRALTQLTTVLDQHSDSRTEVMIAAYDGTVEILLPPTASRKRVAQVLAEKLLYGSQSLRVGRDSQEILRTLRIALETDVSSLLRSIPRDQVMDLACGNTHNYVRTHAQQAYGLVEASALALQEFARSLSTFPGRKTLVHVSDGLPLVPGQEPAEYLVSLCDGSLLMQGMETRSVLACCPPARNYPAAARLELQELDTTKLWDRVAAEANRSRATIYSVQASGLEVARAGTVSSIRTAGSTEFGARVNKQDPLFLMADETGGKALLNTNDFQPALIRMVADQRARYELAFEPTLPSDGKVHRIRLEVDRPATRPHYRKSYIAQTALDQLATHVLAALYHGRAEDQLGVKVSIETKTETSGKSSQVDVRITVPLKRLVLLPKEDRLSGLVTVMLSARDERGATLPVARRTIPLSVGMNDRGETFRYVVRVPLARGHEWLIAIGLRDDLAHMASYVTADVSVP